MHQDGDFHVEAEGPDIHVAGPDHRHLLIDGEVLRVQDLRGPVEVDPDAGAEQRLVVGTLRVVHHALVADLGHEELDARAPARRP